MQQIYLVNIFQQYIISCLIFGESSFALLTSQEKYKKRKQNAIIKLKQFFMYI